MPSIPSLEALRAVLAAGRTGSFTDAAEALGVTHGAVSRRVAAVEAWLGSAVFERHGRGVRLTPAGQRFTRQVEQALESIERTSERWRPRHGRATLRLSVVPSFAKLWLLPRFPALLRSVPDVRVILSVEHRAVDLDAREADIVVRYGRGDWPGLHVRRLFGETLLPVASPALLQEAGPILGIDDLARCPLIHDSDSSQWRAWLAEVSVPYRPRPDDRRFEDYDIVLAAAESGLGLALLRLPLAQAWLDSGRLVAVSDRARANPLSHFVACRSDERRGAVLDCVDALCRLADGHDPSGPAPSSGAAL
ncbi:LysR substrate-binding domain-containing protein [Allosphingosinicella deserti]|uniref:LysR substrate-binding domain-containing protein n=1 Tax=Allosphingosinicella deserti TaxID=2116704 RepID=UPI001304DD5D|nr:LysR substrate-binding domain-containing protein [Sphingomonas deserti]